jgi:hypothetical protein
MLCNGLDWDPPNPEFRLICSNTYNHNSFLLASSCRLLVGSTSMLLRTTWAMVSCFIQSGHNSGYMAVFLCQISFPLLFCYFAQRIMLVALFSNPPPRNPVHSFEVLSLSGSNHSMLPLLWITALECLITRVVTPRCRQRSRAVNQCGQLRHETSSVLLEEWLRRHPKLPIQLCGTQTDRD